MIHTNHDADFEAAAKKLVSRMTRREKIRQMMHSAPAIKRLNIPAYNWWNEALHGVARAGTATVFPQAIALAAIFDEEFMHKIADVISTEGRAKYNKTMQEKGKTKIYEGLTFWSPNINIFRDPRWGRGHETYGEDPYLTARLGVAFIRGIQGNHPKYLKATACAKHYAVHSGPENQRHHFNAIVSHQDLFDTYLPAFEACVKEAKVEGVMGAYNRVNGEPACAHSVLMREILFEKWGFKGYFVSDCWAIKDFHAGHKVTRHVWESAGLAVRMGCHLNCGPCYHFLSIAQLKNLITQEEIDSAVLRLIKTRMKLGNIVTDNDCPFDDIPYEKNNSAEHRELSQTAAEKSMALLKNNGILPLNKETVGTIAVIGPNADNIDALNANYNGTDSEYFTVLAGLHEYLGANRVIYEKGCELSSGVFGEAEKIRVRLAAEKADLVILCPGLDPAIEGEEGDAIGDKTGLGLPHPQPELIEYVLSLGKPAVVVNQSGSAVDVALADEKASAILQAWYSGARGGRAVARLLFGEVSPSGRLPITFYRSDSDLPDIRDYSMKNRTYRYFNGDPLYPFGYGLSYTKFEYGDLAITNSGDSVNVTVTVKNIGHYDSDEVVQCYVKLKEEGVELPKHSLKGFKRIHLKIGEKYNVTFTLPPSAMEYVDEEGNRQSAKGDVTVLVGGSQPDERSAVLIGNRCLSKTFRV